MRVALAAARLFVTSQAFGMGLSAGQYLQSRDCMRRLIALPTPLGAEVAAITRGLNPAHPLLK